MIPLPIVWGTLENLGSVNAVAAARQGFPCGSTCEASWCCHRAVPIAPEEVEILAQAVRTLPTDRFQQVHAQIEAWHAATGLNPGAPDYKAATRLGVVGLATLASGLPAAPCPLLSSADGRGRCLVYDARPAECRMHCAMGPEACQPAPKAPKLQILDVRKIRWRLHAEFGLAPTGLLAVELRGRLQLALG